MIRRLILAALLLSGCAFGQTQIGADTFTYSNGALSSVSAGAWAIDNNSTAEVFTVTSSKAVVSATNSGEVWTGGTFAADQYAQATLTGSTSARQAGVIVRGAASTTSKNYYYFMCSNSQCAAGKYVANNNTFIQSSVSHGLTQPLVLRIEVTGTTLVFKVNGNTPAGFSASYTDSSLSSGRPGISSGGTAGPTLDDWSGGNLVNQVDNPVIGGSASSVTITDSTPGAAICYTEDGTTPTATAGSCTHGATYSAPFATVGTTIKAVASKATYADSAITSYSIAAAPVISPTSGTYFTQQSVTMSCATGSPYYTTDGSTPTAGSTIYTVPFNSTSSGTQTVKALCVASASSAITTAAYSISPAPSELAADDFSAYYHGEMAGQQILGAGSATNGEFQFPLDSYWTGGKWITTGPITGTLYPIALRFIAPVSHATCSGIGGAPCVGGGGAGSIPIVAANTAATYSADQYAKAYVYSVTSGAWSGVAVRAATDGSTLSAYLFMVSTANGSGGGAVYLGKVVSGSVTWFCTLTSQTIANNSTVELRVAGSVLYPLLNGSSIAGCSTTYTDSSLTQGNPGVAVLNGGGDSSGSYLYGWSGGNIGTTLVSNSTPATNWSYGTYTDSMQSGAVAYPWMNFIMNRVFMPTAATLNGVTGWGPLYNGKGQGTAIQQYQAPFGPSGQYQKVTVTVDPTYVDLNNYFFPLMTERWVPGAIGPSGVLLGSDSPCHIAGTDAVCNDEVAYYPGIQPHNGLIEQQGLDTHCSTSTVVGKVEYSCTPFMHITKVKADPTYPNTVMTVAGSFITPLKGDQWYDEYTGGHIRVACKGVGFSTAWQASHTYAKNDLILANGHLQRAWVAGTSASSAPTFGTTWGVTEGSNTISKGAMVTDGGVTWEYYGEPCPTSASWSWVIDAPDTDMQGRRGFPGIWFGADVSSRAQPPFPIIKDWQAGTADSSTSMALIGLSGGLVQPTQWVMW